MGCDILAFLADAPPRARVDDLLAPARARLHASLKAFYVLFGLPLVVCLVVAPLARPAGQTALDALTFAVECWLGVVLVVGVPCWLYLRQDLGTGQRLLRDGVAARCEAAGVGQTPNGATLLRVTWAGDDGSTETTFRVPLTQDQARALVGKSLTLVRLPGRSAIGLWLEGAGLVVTR